MTNKEKEEFARLFLNEIKSLAYKIDKLAEIVEREAKDIESFERKIELLEKIREKRTISH
jgi:hypothetical protein